MSTSNEKMRRRALVNAFPQKIKQDVEIVADFLSNADFAVHQQSKRK